VRAADRASRGPRDPNGGGGGSGDAPLEFERTAVGDHLLLGGDNMDLALAHALEPELWKSKRLDAEGFAQLKLECRIAKEAKDGVVDQWGRAFELEGLVVADGSLFPTSIGVNSQLPIMAMATRIAWRLRDDLRAGS
jgi:choline dehydrogenase-like flavoprotein